MRQVHLITIIILLLFKLTTTPLARAWDMDFGMDLMEDFFVENNYRIDGTPEPPIQSDAVYNLFSLYPSFTLKAGEALSVHLIGDITWTTEISGDAENDMEMTAANAFVHWRSTDLSIRAGLIPLVAGRHYLFSNKETGVEVMIRAAPRHYLTLQAAAIYDRSPFVAAQWEYRFRFLETLSLFGAWFDDRERLVASAWDIIDSSEASILWMGGTATFFLGNVNVDLTGIIEKGEFSFTLIEKGAQNGAGGMGRPAHGQKRVDIDLDGYLTHMDLGINIGNRMALSAFCLMATGDDSDTRDRFEAFVSLTPNMNRLPVFFEGMGREISEDTINLIGSERQGIIAPGVVMSYTPKETVSLSMGLAALFPHEAPASDRDFYGWETDLSATWDGNRLGTFFIEAGLFYPGNYYSTDGADMDPAGRVRAGVYMGF